MKNNAEKNEQNKIKHNWVKQGLLWGLIMFVFLVLLFPWITGEEITLKSILIGIPIWAIGGLLFGLILKYFGSKKDSKPKND